MSCQLTAVCIFMTTCQIVSGQLSFVQRPALSRNHPNSLMSHGVLRRPPSGYHYETTGHVLNTYPKNSYTIKYGLSNIHRVRSNNNNGGSTPSKGGQKKHKKTKKKKKSKDTEDFDDTFSPARSEPTTDIPIKIAPNATTPPATTE